MDFSKKLIEEHDIKANKTLALFCRISAFFILAIMFLNAIGVFIIMWVIYPVLGTFFVILFLPTLFYDILNIHTRILRYVCITAIVITTGVLYSFLDYHVIMMFVFPVLVAALYLDKKIMIYTIIIGFPVMIGSHVLAYVLNQAFNFVTDEPATTWMGLFVFGLIPRLFEYTAFSIIGYAISNHFNNLVESLKKKNNETYFENEKIIKSLSTLADHDSHETGDHIKRVSLTTAIMCKHLGMTEEETWIVSTAAMMHDIGKMTIEKKVLEKEGPLTDEEYEIVKTHTTNGYIMLKDNESEIMRTASLIAYQHHESYDGEGYPNGCKNDEISLNARIVSICDVYDAIVSKRCYKPAKDPQEAIDFLIEEKGKKFDPKLVDIFIEHIEEIKEIYANKEYQ